MLHPNEVQLTSENFPAWMKIASELSGQHVSAVKEQAARQNVKPGPTAGNASELPH